MEVSDVWVCPVSLLEQYSDDLLLMSDSTEDLKLGIDILNSFQVV